VEKKKVDDVKWMSMTDFIKKKDLSKKAKKTKKDEKAENFSEFVCTLFHTLFVLPFPRHKQTFHVSIPIGKII
jgi:hypothetical protein